MSSSHKKFCKILLLKTNSTFTGSCVRERNVKSVFQRLLYVPKPEFTSEI